MSSSKTADKGVHMHQTRNDTESNAKRVSLDTLQGRLADGIDLSLVIKQAHWNLKGPQACAARLGVDHDGGYCDDSERNVIAVLAVLVIATGGFFGAHGSTAVAATILPCTGLAALVLPDELED